MTKKKTSQRVHPAAEAVESDGVRLMKEFEFLKEELKKNDSVVESHNDGIRAAHINLDMAVSFHQKKIAHAQRQRRMLEAQFSNVNELLEANTQGEHADKDCMLRPGGLLAAYPASR